MRLVLAHRHDVAARELAARWGGDALLLTPADLQEERLLLTVDGRGAAAAELPSRPGVRSVLCRLGGVSPGDLFHVDARDVAYAATELDAFLRAWLLAWPGPLVNRPTTTGLNGPGWRAQQWTAAAAAAGLAVRPALRHVTAGAGAVAPPPSAPDAVGDLRAVTVVGNRWFGPVPDALGRALCRLAVASGCTALEVLLDEADRFVQASAWPDVSAPEVAEALAAVLDGAA